MEDDIFSAIDEQNDKSAGEARVWNLFSQILIPIVILVTYLALDGIRRYDHYLKNEQALRFIAENNLNKCVGSNNSVCTSQRDQSWALSQWQKFLLQLNVTMQGKRQEFGFEHFRNATDVTLNGAMIDNPAFRTLGQKSALMLGRNSPDRATLVKTIYLTVLEQVALRDPKQSGLDDDVVAALDHPQSGDPVDFDVSSGVVDASILLPRMRQYFLGRIAAECNTMRDEVVRLQVGVVTQIYKVMRANPEQLTGADRAAAESMLQQGISEQERTSRAKAFLRRFNDSLAERLQAAGYAFLPETWDELKADY